MCSRKMRVVMLVLHLDDIIVLVKYNIFKHLIWKDIKTFNDSLGLFC